MRLAFNNAFLRFAVCVCLSSTGASQTPGKIVVRKLEMVGNYRTKPWVVLHEIPFKPGDTLQINALPKLLKDVKTNLINTKLFSDVHIDTSTDEEGLDFTIRLQELWYLYPGIIFDLADRNFNTWWLEQGRSLKRVNYGFQLQYDNASGRNDRLQLIAQTGYTRKIQLSYDIPRLHHYEKWGYGIDLFQRTQKEIAYQTKGNKSIFYKADRVLLKRQRIESYFSFRPDQNRVFRLTAGYQNNWVDPFVVKTLNSIYFKTSEQQQRFFIIELYGKNSYLDREIYPRDGFSMEADLRKEGLGIFRDLDLLRMNLLWKIYHSFPGEKWSYGSITRLQRQWSSEEPVGFYNRSFIGYSDDQLRGYELYVIDGSDYFYTKQQVKYRFFKRKMKVHRRKEIFLRTFQLIPLEMYLVFQWDIGRVDGYTENGNNLNDRWLFGGGPGLHIVSFNRFVYRLEYSFNHLGESGFFIHINRKY